MGAFCVLTLSLRLTLEDGFDSAELGHGFGEFLLADGIAKRGIVVLVSDCQCHFTCHGCKKQREENELDYHLINLALKILGS